IHADGETAKFGKRRAFADYPARLHKPTKQGPSESRRRREANAKDPTMDAPAEAADAKDTVDVKDPNDAGEPSGEKNPGEGASGTRDPRIPEPRNPEPRNPEPRNPEPRNPEPRNPDPGIGDSRNDGIGTPAAGLLMDQLRWMQEQNAGNLQMQDLLNEMLQQMKENQGKSPEIP
ncbi:MAG: hypothetical protein AAFN70_17215, partial [Planctomycetota bacterium]